jgi:hypothetical protein
MPTTTLYVAVADNIVQNHADFVATQGIGQKGAIPGRKVKNIGAKGCSGISHPGLLKIKKMEGKRGGKRGGWTRKEKARHRTRIPTVMVNSPLR